MFFADTCALASSAGLKIRLVFLGRPPSHRLVSTKTTDGSCTIGRVGSLALNCRRVVYFGRNRASARRPSEEYSAILSEADDAIAKGSAERHHPPSH